MLSRRTVRIAAACVALGAIAFIALAQNRSVQAWLLGQSGFKHDIVDPRVLMEPGTNRRHTDTLLSLLDECIAKVETAHGRPFADQVNVYLCATQESYNKRTAAPEDGNARGAVFADRLFLSPRAFTTQTCEGILIHELSHLHFRQALGSSYTTGIPGWFQEGMAVYISNGGGAEPITVDVARAALLDGPRLQPEDSGTAFPRMAAGHGLRHHMFYRQSELFVKYLAETRPDAFDRFIALLFDKMAFKAAFETAYEQSVADAWENYIIAISHAEQSHAPGPAERSVSNGKSSLPAR